MCAASGELRLSDSDIHDGIFNSAEAVGIRDTDDFCFFHWPIRDDLEGGCDFFLCFSIDFKGDFHRDAFPAVRTDQADSSFGFPGIQICQPDIYRIGNSSFQFRRKIELVKDGLSLRMPLFRRKYELDQQFPGAIDLKRFREELQTEAFRFLQKLRRGSEHITRHVIQGKGQKAVFRFDFSAVSHDVDDLDLFAPHMKADRKRGGRPGRRQSVPKQRDSRFLSFPCGSVDRGAYDFLAVQRCPAD